MLNLSLRFRIFLFFCLLALGSVTISFTGLLLGHRQMGHAADLSPFLSAAAISGFGMPALIVIVWLLFDENVAKPIESVAAGLRLGVHADGTLGSDLETAKYLGDLAPAATAIQQRKDADGKNVLRAVNSRIARLETQHAHLLQILSDIPIAVIVARQDHQIVLYDGQAADLMERECPARLNGSVFDYLKKVSIDYALEILDQHDAKRIEISLESCSGAIYRGHVRRLDGQAGYTLMLEPLSPDAARPLVHDFDLLERTVTGDVGDTRLRDLSLVVFDSETTGLNPKTDAVVQLAAVRVVNGTVVQGAVFETLIDPGRSIPTASTEVHHITDEMVADAPPIEKVAKDFHQFCKGAVVIAHNAPFDMAFLRRASQSHDYAFENPILDTVHLSAIVFGGSAEHTLDALCKRLDIDIPKSTRHTAMGDALATAQAVVAMMPVLEARGMHTYNDIRREAQRHKRILTIDA
ncbi:MAG: exonuclease domain-containing protein [Pseudomonadota bacterium]